MKYKVKFKCWNKNNTDIPMLKRKPYSGQKTFDDYDKLTLFVREKHLELELMKSKQYFTDYNVEIFKKGE